MAAELTPVEALTPAITLLALGGGAALASRALKLSPIVGYIAAGLLIGPHALNLLEESGATHLLAELGVVFLLFDIGMHISMRELKESRSDLLGLAPLHMLLTAFAFSAILKWIGADWPVAIAIGISLALSSTAVVSSILSERGLKSCPLGRSAINVLIFQDIVAIFLLIFANSLGGDSNSLLLTMGAAAGQALVAFLAAIIAGRYLVGPVFRALAATKNQEAFTAAALLLVIGAACATYLMGLSLTLGAFLAGLAVSGTPFRHQIQTETGPFRGLLLSFFFISVGMMIDVPALIANLSLVIAAAAGIILLKTGLGYVAARLNKWTVPGGTQLGFLLAQGSEFTLVILSIFGAASANLIAAGAAPLIDPAIETIIVAAVVLSLAIAPSWAGLGMSAARKLAAKLAKDTPVSESAEAGKRPVIVFGMTPEGRLAIDALRDHDIPYVALDNDPERFMAAVSDGYDTKFGDAANLRLVDAIGANNARAVVVGAPRYEVSRAMTPAANRDFPDTARFVTVSSEIDRQRFADLGMRAHHSMTDPRGIEMAADMLQVLGVDTEAVSAWLTSQSERFDIDDVTEDILTTEAQAEAA